MAETVGKVYSTALFELCTEQDKLEKVFSDYSEFQELMKDKECADYLRFLASPLISGRDKADSLKAVFGDKIDPLLLDFLGIGFGKVAHQIVAAFVENRNNVF